MSQTQQVPSNAEAAVHRRDERRALSLRDAKVVCQSGEYLCQIRNVSELGISLSYFHEAPPEARIILALANGLTIPIERIWSGKSQTGYRFAAPVSLQDFRNTGTPYTPRPVRLTLTVPARVLNGRASHSVRTLDLSTDGAKIECAGIIQTGHLIGFQAEGMGQQLGQVVWSDETLAPYRYGIQFQHPIDPAELASFALRQQPFGPKGSEDFGDTLRKASAA